jgi:acyl-CoA thioesterase I
MCPTGSATQNFCVVSRVLVARRRWPVLLTAALVVALLASGMLNARARGAETEKCGKFTRESAARSQVVTGSGERVVVIGDSWSAGLGLSSMAASWPSRLPGRVHVAGFSGSGFSADASPCGRVSFAARAPQALAGGADLLVVEGGLNDFDRSNAQIRAGFARLMKVAAPYRDRMVVVGPALAPSRAREVPRVDALLARLSAAYGVPYVATDSLRLPYLPDRLHLTPAGHRQFGDYVARQLAGL